MISLKNNSIILFDGVCNLCNSSVQFIIRNDPKKLFLFASLQSDAASEILLQFPFKKMDLTSIVFIEDDQIYVESTAVLKITRKLKGGYSLLYGFIIIPRFIRDWVYQQLANNRYQWFGKKDQCMVPTADLKDRFL